MLSAIIIAAAVVGGVGIVVGLMLGVAGEKFKIETDPKEEALLEVLPGNNCGACGYPGCSGLAAAIAKGEAPTNACMVGGAFVAAEAAAIMGVAPAEFKHMVAFVKCDGNPQNAPRLYDYTGVQDCNVIKQMQNGGPKSCRYGCMGCGNCVRVCEFDAIHIVNGVAVVDKERCRACKKCINTCPQHVIDLIPYDSTHSVKCNSHHKGKEQMQVCTVGCIGCRKCEKACPKGAITVTDFLASIDHDKCVGCGICARECPRHIIIGKAAPTPKKKPAAAAAKPAAAAEKAEVEA